MGFLSHFSVLIIGAVSLLASFGLFNFYFPLFISKQVNETMVGLLATAHFAGYFWGAFQLSRWIGRVGHIRVFAFVTSLIASGLLLLPLTSSILGMSLLRFLIGFGHAGVYVVTEGWINARVENTGRGKVFAIYRIIELLSLSLGQFGMVFLDTNQTTIMFTTMAVMTIVSVMPLSLTLQRQPEIGVETNFSLKQAFQTSPLTAIGMLLTGIVNSCFWGLTPLYLIKLGMVENDVPFIFAFFILGGVLLMFPIGRWSDFRDRRIFIIGCMLACCLGAITLSLNQGSLVTLKIVFFIMGASAMPLYSLLMTHGISRAYGQNETAVCSEFLFLFGIGAMIGPTICGSLMRHSGPIGFSWHIIFFNMVGFLFGLFQYIKNPEVPEQEKEDFVVVPSTTPNILEVDTLNTHLEEELESES